MGTDKWRGFTYAKVSMRVICRKLPKPPRKKG